MECIRKKQKYKQLWVFNIVKCFINKKLGLTNLDCWLDLYGSTFIEQMILKYNHIL